MSDDGKFNILKVKKSFVYQFMQIENCNFTSDIRFNLHNYYISNL